MFSFSFETNCGDRVILSHGAQCSTYADSHKEGSKGVEQSVASNAVKSALLKSVFHDVDMMPVGLASGHTHAKSAAARSTASRLIDEIARAAGLRAIFYQGSSADVRNGRHVVRTYHWAKDVFTPVQDVVRTERDLVAMVDVDYYVDMPQFLAEHDCPLLLYTTIPSAASADRGEYKYTFDKEGNLDYLVSGGGHFTHPLWDWTGDAVSVKTFMFFGLVTSGYHTYALERREIDEDHSLILLTPLFNEVGTRSWGAEELLKAKPLIRFNPVCGEFARFDVNKPDGLWRTTARVGDYLCANVKATEDDAVSVVARGRTTRLTLATVRGICKDREGTEVEWAYHLAKLQHRKYMVDIASGVRRFQWMSRDGKFDDDAKPSMVAFMTPIVDGGFVPDKTIGNDQRSIDYRVEKLKKTQPLLNTFISRVMDEFVSFTVGDAVLAPCSVEEVEARQGRPSQRRILEEAEFEPPTGDARAMQKSEAYPKVTDPRNITMIHGRAKKDYARYTYAFNAGVMKKQPWYAFSKTPVEIANRVAAICKGAKTHSDMKDFNRMDGRVGVMTRELNRRLYVSAFHHPYHSEMYSAMKRNYNLKVRSTFGVHYESWWSQCSGACDTSDSNTCFNAFTAYLGYRLDECDPEEAWDALGLYAGDDGVDADANRTAMLKAAEMMGQVLELERVRRGDLGVHFLARYYGPDVWFGAPDSVCDIKRQLSKFHLTVCLPSSVTPADKLVDKAFAFSLSDSNTLVFAELITTVQRLFPHKWPTPTTWKNYSGKWVVDLRPSVQYPNDCADWVADLFELQLPEFDLAKFRENMDKANQDSILTCSSCQEDVPLLIGGEGVVLVDGDLHGSPVEPIVSTQPEIVIGEAHDIIPEIQKPKRSRSRKRLPRAQRAHAKAGGSVKTKAKQQK
jgi:hypothetical protein